MSSNIKLKSYVPIKNISIESNLEFIEEKIRVSFMLKGDLDNYIFPSKSILKRVNGLWKSTCFELFLANKERESYYELNVSSSLAWNFYYLNSYRADIEEAEFLSTPKIKVYRSQNEFKIVVEFSIENLENFELYNVACILLNKKNKREFWTVNHLRSQPDFHDKKSFLKLTNYLN